MTTVQHIIDELQQAQQVLEEFLASEQQIQNIQKAGSLMGETIQAGGKILSCGNGGSHCDAMHFAEELTGRYRENRKPLAALAISDASHISCVSNDFGYDQVFSRYVEAIGKKGDVLLGISTSGNSENVTNAFETARSLGMKTVALTGNDGGKLRNLADIEVNVPYNGYADRIQEIHIKVIHIFIQIIEDLNT